eukprot:TRINITY_DN9074_c0_g1_i1.p1 TRINITY_DN9074_c0_g1~~TRINITY_DN9074_c0_g1_i1.p1  ORF type:complete len:398 (-),score=89.72 TRINITY_DN9074_c0_g1_i1:11-1204(-)
MWVKVMSFLCSHRSIEFSDWFFSRDDITEKILEHIGCDHFPSLLMAIIECQYVMEMNFSCEINWTSRLLVLIGKKLTMLKDGETRSPNLKLNRYQIEMDLTNIGDFVDSMIKKYPKTRLIGRFQHPDFFLPLLQLSFSSDIPTAPYYLSILLKIVPTCKNLEEYETFQLPPLIAEMLNLANRNGENRGSEEEAPIQLLYGVLSKHPVGLAHSVHTTCGMLAPLGLTRLNCVQLVLQLIQLNFKLVDTALIEYRLISKVVDLFFQFKWNNILHKTVENIVSFTLQSKPSYFCLYLLRECILLERILQAQQNFDQEMSMHRQQTQYVTVKHAYMGHISNIAASISKSSKEHAAIFYLLEDIPNRGWKKFEDKMKLASDRSKDLWTVPDRKGLRQRPSNE